MFESELMSRARHQAGRITVTVGYPTLSRKEGRLGRPFALVCGTKGEDVEKHSALLNLADWRSDTESRL